MKKSNSGMHGHGMPIETRPTKPIKPSKGSKPMETVVSYPKIHSHESKLFTIVEKEENKVIITIGSTIASSKVFKNVKQATNYIANKPWELLVNVMCIVNEKMKNFNPNENETIN